MCDCHPRPPKWKEIRAAALKEPRTKEQWILLHNMIEDYETRIVADFVKSKADAAVPPREEPR